MFYSLYGILALVLVLVLNHDIFTTKNDGDLATRRYRSFVKVLFFYFITDALWGIFDTAHLMKPLYIDTFAYHIAVALSIVLWCNYVVAYLNPPKIISQGLVHFGYAFSGCEIICLVINFFTPIFFWFDPETGLYETGLCRHIALGIQITMYALVAIMSFIIFIKAPERTRNRYLVICIFCLVMTAVIVTQIWHPFLPLYTTGLIIGMCAIHVYVHEDERQEIRQQLENNEKILKENTAIIANAGYGIWKIRMVANGQNRMVADETLQKILGVEHMNLTPEELYTFYHERLKEDVDNIETDDYISMKQGTIRSRQLKWEHPTKGDIYLHAGGTNYISNLEGEVISGYCTDVTESKKKEKRSDLVIRSLARSYQFLTYIKMSDMTYVTYNLNMEMTEEQVNKYSTGNVLDAIEFACTQRVAPLFKEEMIKFADITTINERMANVNVLISQFKDMKDVWHEWSYVVASRNEDGTIRHLIWGVRKIEDEKQAELRRQRILEENIAANKAKTMFLQNMSHEIRTPLNALFGFAQLLGLPDGSWTDAEKEQYNTYIHNSYNMLDMLIGDIIDIADSEHGNYRIQISDVNVNQICSNAVMSVEFRAPGGVNMYFTSDLPDDHVITSDGRRIQQVIINYLTNACKHTTKGEIHLHCSSTENPGKLTFSVTDTGTGVPADKADEIFNRFTKLNQFSQGSGLGLNICLMIAEKLNGKVYLDKSYTDGARFVFVIDDK
ncbi:MAG: HAMP domain-containing histidine kinase [Bacteroidales bacterium]|nr:HAMP domain-containing histidine kinase [Candidatus Cryptobacteroides caccocaballi]